VEQASSSLITVRMFDYEENDDSAGDNEENDCAIGA